MPYFVSQVNQEQISAEELDKFVTFATATQVALANGWLVAANNPTKANTALNLMELPKLKLGAILQSFPAVLQRGDDVIIFENTDIDTLSQKGDEPTHINELGLFLSQDEVEAQQAAQLEEQAAKLAEQAARIAELEALLVEKNQKQRKQD